MLKSNQIINVKSNTPLVYKLKSIHPKPNQKHTAHQSKLKQAKKIKTGSTTAVDHDI